METQVTEKSLSDLLGLWELGEEGRNRNANGMEISLVD
jgi:hypothetical protein